MESPGGESSSPHAPGYDSALARALLLGKGQNATLLVLRCPSKHPADRIVAPILGATSTSGNQVGLQICPAAGNLRDTFRPNCRRCQETFLPTLCPRFLLQCIMVTAPDEKIRPSTRSPVLETISADGMRNAAGRMAIGSVYRLCQVESLLDTGPLLPGGSQVVASRCSMCALKKMSVLQLWGCHHHPLGHSKKMAAVGTDLTTAEMAAKWREAIQDPSW